MINSHKKLVTSDFSNVLHILANPEKFKVKLGIGGEAYTSIKAGKLIGQIWSLGTASSVGAGTAAAVTAPSAWGSFLISAGLASNPTGWIIGAAMASAGAVYGVSRLFNSYQKSRVDDLPKFLNTNLDKLSASLFDFLGSLSLKVAAIDGHLDQSEKNAIKSYFSEEWGYDVNYLDSALSVLEENINRARLPEMTKAFAEFAINNSDCNFEALRQEIKAILTEVAEADGLLDEREEIVIEHINKSLGEHAELAKSASRAIGSAVTSVSELAGSSARGMQSTFRRVASKLVGKKS